jgi:hypothetical protein
MLQSELICQQIVNNLNSTDLTKSPNIKFMEAVDDQIQQPLSPQALAIVLATMRLNISEVGLQMALQYEVHVAFARYVDKLHKYSVDSFGNELFFIEKIKAEPLHFQNQV